MKVELEIGAKADVSDVEAKFAAAGDAVQRFGDDVDAGTSKADAASGRMDSVADSADNMASRSSQAAGGIGDLGGALSLMPGPLGAVGAGMEAVAPAIMGVTGAADLLNLATTSNIVVQTKQKAATIANTVVTRTATVAQKALNLAMRANPIGIIITLILALVAGLVLAYKKSETFRNIINAVGKVGAAAIGWVVDKVGALVGWLRDKLAPGATWVKDKVVDGFRAMLDPIGWVIDKVKAVFGWFGDVIDRTKEALGLGREYGSEMGRILGDVKDSLADIGNQIRDNATAQGQGGASGGGVGAPRAAAGVNLNLAVTTDPLADKDRIAREILDVLRPYLTRTTGRVALS